MQAGDTEAALAKLAEALAADPGNDDARFDYAKLLIAGGAFEEAQAVLKDPLTRIPKPLRFEALATWLQAMEYVDGQAFAKLFGGWELPQFDAKIAENKRDFETRYAKAAALLSAGLLTESMDELLEIIQRDRSWNQELARKTVVAILELLTPSKSKHNAEASHKSAGGIELAGKTVAALDPQAELVSRYRRRLSMALN
jgi:putative thioredoxin